MTGTSLESSTSRSSRESGSDEDARKEALLSCYFKSPLSGFSLKERLLRSTSGTSIRLHLSGWRIGDGRKA